MRKVLLTLLSCLFIVSVIACASSGSGGGESGEKEEKMIGSMEEPSFGPIVEAKRGTPAAIDGTMDPVFEDAQVITTEMVAEGDGTGASAEARLVYDDEFLYVYIKVTDPVLSMKSANPWEQDSIEVYIDEMNTKATSYKSGVAQYRVNYKGDVSGGTGAKLKSFKSGVQEIDGGYAVTTAIPFSMGKPMPGSYSGFDFQVNDDDGRGSRSGIKDWANDTNNNYQSPEFFGNVKFLP